VSKKSGSAYVSPDKRWKNDGKGCALPLSAILKRLEELGAVAGQHRNVEDARLGWSVRHKRRVTHVN